LTRILQIIPFPSMLQRDGGQIRVQQTGKALEAAGFTVIRCPVYRAARHANSIDEQPVINLDEAGGDPRYQHTWQLYDLTNGEVLANDAGCFAAFRAFVDRSRPDVLMLEHPWLWPAVKKLPASNRPPVIYNSHNLEAGLKCRMLKDACFADADSVAGEIEALERDLVGAAAAVSATTEADADVYRIWDAGPVVVAPNGAEQRARAHLRDVLPDPLRHWWRYLLFVASAHPPNGTGFAELVMGGLAGVRPNERVVVAGSVCDLIAEHLRNRNATTIGSDRLALLGQVSSFKLDCLIENAAGMLLPITYGGGSNIKTAEALLAGHPIIATSKAFRDRETFTDMPGVIIAETEQAFAAAMRRVLSGEVPSPPQDERLGSVSWDHTLQPIVNLVRDVCAAHRADHPVQIKPSDALPEQQLVKPPAAAIGIEIERATIEIRSPGENRSDFECHATLLAQFHNRYGIVPDYEHILECGYRRVIPPDATVIDVGAHEGRHTAVLSELVGQGGRVLAFEPLPHLATALRDKGFDHRVQIHECALSDFSGRSSFTYMRGTPEESGLRERIPNKPQQADPITIDVEVRQLDEYLAQLSNVRFIKIDVEGGEVACLRGATKLLGRFRPFISVEYGKPSYSVYGLNARSLYDTAESLGYQIADLFGAICPDLPAWERACDLSYWDWFLVPRERADEWRIAFPNAR
jgi:FkbM family methyltransferase